MIIFKNTVLTGLFILSTTSLATAGDFDPHQCNKIIDVDVPFDVRKENNKYLFTQNQNTISITPSSYTVNGVFVNIVDYSGYYDALEAFLVNSTSLAQTMGDIYIKKSDRKQIKSQTTHINGNNTQNSMENITNMCHAILNLAALNNLAANENSAFLAGINIVLSE